MMDVSTDDVVSWLPATHLELKVGTMEKVEQANVNTMHSVCKLFFQGILEISSSVRSSLWSLLCSTRLP